MSHDFHTDKPGYDIDVFSQNPYLNSYLESLRDVETRINEPDCSDTEAGELIAELAHAWRYDRETFKMIGKIRPYDDDYAMPDADPVPDALGRFAINDSDELLRFVSVETIDDDAGRSHIVFGVTDASNDPSMALFLIAPNDVFRWDFTKMLPEVRAHILHQIEPTLMKEIDMMLTVPLNDPTGLRALSIKPTPNKYGEYDLIENIEAYVNERSTHDRHFPSVVTIAGEVIDGEGRKGIVEKPSDVRATLTELSLIIDRDISNAKAYRIALTVHIPHVSASEEDEEITFLLDSLVDVRSMRPTIAALGSLSAGLTIDEQMQSALGVTVATPKQEKRESKSLARIRHLERVNAQLQIDGLLAYSREATQQDYPDYESALAASEIWDARADGVIDSTIIRFKFVVEGDLERPRLKREGFGKGRPGLVSIETNGYGPSEAGLYDTDHVTLQGLCSEVQQTESGTFRVRPYIAAQSNMHSMTLRLTDPVTSRPASLVHYDDYCYIPLDGDIIIQERHLYDQRRCSESMDVLKQKLAEYPDLKRAYKILSKLQKALFLHPGEDSLYEVDACLFQELGTICGGDPEASVLVSDVLNQLLGDERVIAVRGAMYDTTMEGGRVHEATVVVHSVLGEYSLANQQEPMLAVALPNATNSSHVTHLMPLSDLERVAW